MRDPKLSEKINGIEYAPLVELLGKVEITEHTPQSTIGHLMNSNPHTLKINGVYSK